MSAEHLRVIVVVYTSALLPLLFIPLLTRRGVFPAWVPKVYGAAFLACALGWELWFTYGWLAGESVEVRRAAALNDAIPMHLNWALNSLADAGSICLLATWVVWLAFGRSGQVLRKWHWGAFALFMFLFLSQNILVEMFLYHDQLAGGKPLSWAPLVPTGPWLNPTLFEFNGRTITFQGQVAWLLMGPLYYAGLTRYLSREAPLPSTQN